MRIKVQVKVKAICDVCGKEVLRDKYNLKSCRKKGMKVACSSKCSAFIRKKKNADDSIGKKYGRLTVIEPDLESEGLCRVICKCDCGNIVNKPLHLLKNVSVSSCGCLRLETIKKNGRGLKHGLCHKYKKEYSAWADMKQRCVNKKNKHYKDYGGRGISFCERWNDFKLFFDDMGSKQEGQSIDRTDVNGNYCPENCRWANNDQQANNKRVHHNITYKGVTKNITQWSKHFGLGVKTLGYRLSSGWDLDDVFTKKSARRENRWL